MTTEQKAKVYDDAIENMRKFRDALSNHEETDLWVLKKEIVKDIEYYFPELAESEDEKIRKELIDFVRSRLVGFPQSEKYIAWLEKQCEQKHTAEEVLIKAGLKPYKDGDQWCVLLGDNIQEGICGFGNTIEDALYAFLKDLIASQGKQKTTDKVEPKFHEGDWVVYNSQNTVSPICQITKIDGDIIDLKGLQGERFQTECWDLNENYHLWTIQDAKDGDVLTLNNEYFLFKGIKKSAIDVYIDVYISYCFVDSAGTFREGGEFLSMERGVKVHPSTKEQRDLLFQKMKEAGYEWDSEKKELKKIHVIDEGKTEMDYCFTKMMNGEKVTPAWSEEDEKRIERIYRRLWAYRKGDTDEIYQIEQDVNWLKSIKERVQPQPKQEWREEDEKMQNNLIRLLSNISHYIFPDLNSPNFSYYSEEINWLKSLRPMWKPSDEQMEMLKELVDDNDQRYFYPTLKSLYNDLEKLKENKL